MLVERNTLKLNKLFHHISLAFGGLVVNVTNQRLVASPDGISLQSKARSIPGVSEIQKSLLDKRKDSRKRYYQLQNKDHDYYYQMQCAMLCINRHWCDLVDPYM